MEPTADLCRNAVAEADEVAVHPTQLRSPTRTVREEPGAESHFGANEAH
jgi:hypothetical protein